MSTQQRSRSAVAPNAHSEWPDVASAVLVSAIVVPFIGFYFWFGPSISVIALASAAIIAFAAWRTSFCMSL